MKEKQTMSTQSKGRKITTSVIRGMKKKGEKITMLTAYDYAMASLLDEVGVEMLLVGDSLGMVVLGYESTLPVTMNDMLHHTRAVSRGANNAMVVADLPFMSYQCSVEEAVRNAGRFLQEAGAHAVKLEGGREIAESVKRMTVSGIPVVGHLGLTPQSVQQFGGFKVQGKGDAAAQRIMEDAKIIEEAGAFSVVLECVPAPLAQRITDDLAIPTIGIGAGAGCDGQVLVVNDMLGIYERFTPKFVKKYANLSDNIRGAVKQYIEEVKNGTFPDQDHSFL
ncbi:3-methyl-2-oxobutanoate hydroxymethyltransferase [Syntrophus aciditrophicus SB]|nr:3-methyl-2-oxobutanoate hydroxymethyltransferase [Syntrophus aciditrophicus SB]